MRKRSISRSTNRAPLGRKVQKSSFTGGGHYTLFGRENPYDRVLARKATRPGDPASEVKDGHGADVFFKFNFFLIVFLFSF